MLHYGVGGGGGIFDFGHSALGAHWKGAFSARFLSNIANCGQVFAREACAFFASGMTV